MMSGFSSGDDEDSPVYHAIIKVAILLAVLGLIALGVDTYRHPDADNRPAAFSCSLVP